MSESSQQPRKRKRKLLPDNILDLPDDEAILKLFPKRVVKALNKLVDHVPGRSDDPTKE